MAPEGLSDNLLVKNDDLFWFLKTDFFFLLTEENNLMDMYVKYSLNDNLATKNFLEVCKIISMWKICNL